jgi:hypothetical protein
VDTFREFEKGGGHYTWWSPMSGARARNVGWRIDYFLISAALRPRLKRAFIQPSVPGSDHCPVGIEIALTVPFPVGDEVTSLWLFFQRREKLETRHLVSYISTSCQRGRTGIIRGFYFSRHRQPVYIRAGAAEVSL